jgi:REP element-mobilizing transposase RayT
MPRKPRFIIPGVPVHIVQRGRSREPLFYEEADYWVYPGSLTNASANASRPAFRSQQ